VDVGDLPDLYGPFRALLRQNELLPAGYSDTTLLPDRPRRKLDAVPGRGRRSASLLPRVRRP
ncbi:MAG: hypothetical protein M3479_05285, partial [Actinomycetota bacterium]|nr:hypothetical protein [Actinomycetota bacterium]